MNLQFHPAPHELAEGWNITTNRHAEDIILNQDDLKLNFGAPLASQEIVAQRLAAQNKRAVGLRLEELMKDTKFTKEEIRMMYRGFKQVRKV